MCELCGPRISRRAALALAGGVVTFSAFGGTASARRAPDADELVVEPRSRWAGDSRPPLGTLEAEDVRFLLVHHAASDNGADPIGVMRSIYDFHTGPEKGWPDVAYNFFIDQNGVVYEARAGSLEGAVVASATGGNQGFSQLVCLLGDFTNVMPTDAALDALIVTLSWLADRYGIDVSTDATTAFVSRGSNLWPEGESVVADTVAGHREMSRTACPGDTFHPFLKREVRARVAETRTVAPDTSESTTSDVRTPPLTRVIVPPSTTVPPTSAPTTSAPPDSLPSTTVPSTVPDTDVSSSGEPPASVVVDDPASGGSGINVPLAVAGGASVLLGGALLARGVRGPSRDDAVDLDADDAAEG